MNFPENSALVLQKALSGDNTAWEALFKHLWPVIAGVAASKVKAVAGDAMVEDIAQNVFVRLTENNAKRLHQYDPKKGALESFVAKVAYNVSIDFLRSNANHLRSKDIAALPEPIAESGVSLPMLEEWEMTAALNTLSARERLVVTLLFKRELDVVEAAKQMNITPETVRSEKSHALKKLKKFFGQA